MSGPIDHLAGSHWYVPDEDLLAYLSVGKSFIQPAPSMLWDQTLWSIDSMSSGNFLGVSQTSFDGHPLLDSVRKIDGTISDGGQVRIEFTEFGPSPGNPVIGIGQVRDYNGQASIEMQMISGSAGGLLVTHWAHMLPYDPATFTPPAPQPNALETSTEWNWTKGTMWTIKSDLLFGAGNVGTFNFAEYHNGYFWGEGHGPSGSSWETFTNLGSITPEGNVLFNMLAPTDTPMLVSLAGVITPNAGGFQMTLGAYGYQGDVSTSATAILIVPEITPDGLGPAGALCAAAVGLLERARYGRRRGARCGMHPQCDSRQGAKPVAKPVADFLATPRVLRNRVARAISTGGASS